jgi:hypothetical protein
LNFSSFEAWWFELVGGSQELNKFFFFLLALQVGGVSKIETIKYAHDSHGTQT